jgi:hypothetical protein
MRTSFLYSLLVTATFPIAKNIIAEPKELIRIVKKWRNLI